MVPALQQQPGTVVTTWVRGSDMTEPTRCAEAGCAKPARARGLCWAHYKRLQRIGLRRLTTEERIMARVVVAPSGCWEWTGELSAGGYGRIHVDGRKRTAHRVLFEILRHPIAMVAWSLTTSAATGRASTLTTSSL